MEQRIGRVEEREANAAVSVCFSFDSSRSYSSTVSIGRLGVSNRMIRLSKKDLDQHHINFQHNVHNFFDNSNEFMWLPRMETYQVISGNFRKDQNEQLQNFLTQGGNHSMVDCVVDVLCLGD